jgi:hypothetical protein
MPKPHKKADAGEVLAAVTKAVTTGKSVRKAAIDAGLSRPNAQNLEIAIGTSIEDFRDKTKKKLMSMSDKMLKQIDERMEEIPASGWAFTYACIRDSISSMDAKTAPGASAVNIQVNNYGTDAAAKTALIDVLHGIIPIAPQPAPILEVVSPTPQPVKAPEPQ